MPEPRRLFAAAFATGLMHAKSSLKLEVALRAVLGNTDLECSVVDNMATAWFLGCASVHPSGKRNTTVASPTVPSRLSLNYHPFRQEVSIQASWVYINVTIQA